MEVSRKKLVKFMINDDIDGLAEYIEELINNAYEDGYDDGFSDGLADGYNLQPIMNIK